MFKFFRKPTIVAKLIDKGHNSKVTLINISPKDTIILLFSITKQIAAIIKMDHRALLNRLIDIDKGIIKTKKEQTKAVKYHR